MSSSKHQINSSNDPLLKQQQTEITGPSSLTQGAKAANVAKAQRAVGNPARVAADDVLALQQTVGNRTTSKFLASGGQSQPVIQAKLTVGPVNDTYEQEADRVADQVVSQGAVTTSGAAQRNEEDGIQMKPLAANISAFVQREGALEEEEMMQTKRDVQREALEEEEMMQTKRDVQREALEEEEMMQTKRDVQRTAGDGSFEAGDNVESRLNSIKGGGAPLPDNVKSEMESGFGADLSGVRIHTGGQADALNQDLQAKAFTSGPDIAFKQGQFKPDTTEGKKLLAHELTHVVQQGAAAPAQRKTDTQHES